jgi:hypothetical protein
MEDEKARLLAIGYHVGWSPEKLSKELKDAKLSATDLIRLSDDMEDQDLLRNPDDYQLRPAMVVIRERDYDRIKSGLDRHTQEFTKLIQDNWQEIEAFAGSLEGSKHLSREQVLYEVVVSGILLGGLVDAFWEDNTMMLRPPRRGRTERYYAWIVESNPALAGKLKREVRESSGYRIITIGNKLSDERLNPEDLRGKASVYDEAEARRYRTFISVFTRDKLLPFFKSRRSEVLQAAALIEAARRVAVAEFFAWYYFTMVDRVADNLAAEKRIAPPDTLYTYAVSAPPQ